MLERQLACRQRPFVLAFFIDGDMRRRKARVSKHANRHNNGTWQSTGLPVNRRGAYRAEAESGWLATIAEARPPGDAPLDRHLLARKARLRSKDAAGAFLAFKAMAYGDASRLAFACQAELSAATRCDTGHHARIPGSCLIITYASQMTGSGRGQRCADGQPRLSFHAKVHEGPSSSSGATMSPAQDSRHTHIRGSKCH